jgi:membrane protein DedA with SNARE-associated domain
MENFLTQVMTSHGYLALIIFAFVEACCIPISSEITFAFAGVIAATHPDKFSLAAVIIIGTLAEMGGSLTSYAVGRRGGRHLLDRYGRWVLISRSDLDRAERVFSGRGSWAVAVARALPLVRCFASFGAGVVEIPLLPFTAFSLIGTAAWATGLTLLGYNLGHTVDRFFKSFSVVGIILLVLLLAGLILHRVHAIRKDSHGAAAPTRGGARRAGSHRAGAQGIGSESTGSQGSRSQGFAPQGYTSQGYGSQGAGSHGAGPASGAGAPPSNPEQPAPTAPRWPGPDSR